MSEDTGNHDGTLRAENARRRLANGKLRTDLAASQAQVKALTAERDGLKSAPPDPKVLQMEAELASLKAAARLAKHKDGLKALAKDVGINKSVPIDRLIALSGYKAEAEEFDAKAAKSLLEGMKDTDPYLFGGPDDDDETHPADRGGPDPSHLWRAVQQRGESGGASARPGAITREQARDPAWVMQQAAERRRAAQGK